jgi:hypothetical protein
MKRLTESRARALIEAHFSRRISPSEERIMRAHLEACEACGKVYDAHLLFEKMSGESERWRDRLATGLGLDTGRQRAAAPVWLAAGFVAAAALLLLRVGAAKHGGANAEPEFAARGTMVAEEPRVRVYTLDPVREVDPNRRVKASDRLAFAYTNPTAFRNLLVFGVDEHRHVYWYYPAWHSRDEHPRAVAIEGGPAARELPEGIRHDLDGHRLTVHAVFLNEEMPVERVEEIVAGVASQDEPLHLPGAYEQRVTVDVERGP